MTIDEEVKFLASTHNIPEELIKYVRSEVCGGDFESLTLDNQRDILKQTVLLILSISKALEKKPPLGTVYRSKEVA